MCRMAQWRTCCIDATWLVLPLLVAIAIADGLLTSLGVLTWPIVRDHVEAIHTVSDPEIVEAMKLVWSRMKLVIEPSAAVPVAAVLADEFKALADLDRVGVILSGGNVEYGAGTVLST